MNKGLGANAQDDAVPSDEKDPEIEGQVKTSPLPDIMVNYELSQVWNLPDSHYDQTPESSMSHGEEHSTFHGQAEASSQMRVDRGDRDEKPN